jgi:Lon-like protease
MKSFKNKGFTILIVLILVIVVVLNYIQIPYYIHKPGTADRLEPMVKVQNGYKDKGQLRLVTIYEIHASVLQYLIAKYDFNKYTTIFKADMIQYPDESSKELEIRNLDYMKGAQDSATYVAYKAANKNPVIDHLGVKVLNVNSKMPVSKALQPGDVITQANGQRVETVNDLQSDLKGEKKGDPIQLKVKRGDKEVSETTTLATFPKEWTPKGEKPKVGLGILESNDINVNVHPSVSFNTEGIGGPSAGLMMTMETYNQLTPGDITKGYNIAGTGTMDFDGNVGPIGGIQQKIVAANNVGVQIFFAPEADHEAKDAEAAVKDIHSKIKVVPVNTFDDALHYLQNLKAKA